MTDSTNGANLTDGFDLIDPQPHAKNGTPHASWTALRRHDPLHRCEPAGYAPFWAVTKHADVFEISNRPDVFLSYPGISTRAPTCRSTAKKASARCAPSSRWTRRSTARCARSRARGSRRAHWAASDETIEESARHLDRRARREGART